MSLSLRLDVAVVIAEFVGLILWHGAMAREIGSFRSLNSASSSFDMGFGVRIQLSGALGLYSFILKREEVGNSPLSASLVKFFIKDVKVFKVYPICSLNFQKWNIIRIKNLEGKLCPSK